MDHKSQQRCFHLHCPSLFCVPGTRQFIIPVSRYRQQKIALGSKLEWGESSLEVTGLWEELGSGFPEAPSHA